MEVKQVAMIIVVGVVAWFAGSGRLGFPNGPTPAPPRGPDMVSVFSVNQDKAEARRHAAFFAKICEKVADTIEVDARRGDSRRIATGYDTSVYRSDLLFYCGSGWTFSTKYPGIRRAVGDWLDAEAGTSPKKLSDADVKKWVDAFRALSASAAHAAEKIK